MSLDFWSPGRAPQEPTYYRTEDAEPEYCDSLLWLPPDPERRGPQSLRCPLDAAHLHDQFDARHGRGLTRWTTAEAALALADFGPRPAALCYEDGCNRPVVAGGRCSSCLTSERERDENHEVIEA